MGSKGVVRGRSGVERGHRVGRRRVVRGMWVLDRRVLMVRGRGSDKWSCGGDGEGGKWWWVES